MNRYLDKKTSEYLASLGCVSESGWFYASNLATPNIFNLWDEQDCRDYSYDTKVPAFDLMDILKRENAERIWPGKYEDGEWPWFAKTTEVLVYFQYHPDTWTTDVARIINPTTPTDL